MGIPRRLSKIFCKPTADRWKVPEGPTRPPSLFPTVREANYRESIARNDAALALRLRGQELLRGGRDESALFLLQQAESICPTLVLSVADQAWIYVARKEKQQAISAADRVRNLAPLYPELNSLQQAIDALA